MLSIHQLGRSIFDFFFINIHESKLMLNAKKDSTKAKTCIKGIFRVYERGGGGKLLKTGREKHLT